ncbi:MAG: hypothetical protein PUC12_10635 [Clostridiales bacterium]|nr:hypothetical protein [Clostridiales bacterium]
MGIFSKKTVRCEKCGKEYQVRITFGTHICDECVNREFQKKQNVRGYIDYAMRMGWQDYTEEQLDQIDVHRNQILEKYRQVQGISKSELQNASDNYKKLTDDQVSDILVRIANSSITSTMGAAYSGCFFVPTAYEKTIVDVEDVFAVGYTNDYKLQADGQEIILCAVFTNDPYIPVFPMIYVGKLGFFDVMKSKKGRQGVNDLFESICPNLQYPVQDLKNLKKQVKADGSVKGNIELKFMLERISDATSGIGIFNTNEMHSDLYPSSAEMMDQYGYLQEQEIDQILHMDKMLNRNFWNKAIKKFETN